MDARIKKAVLAKIEETISSTDEISKIQKMLSHIAMSSNDDFAIMASPWAGWFTNSFHYQTRRTLKRNATEEEFAEFLDILAKRARCDQKRP